MFGFRKSLLLLMGTLAVPCVAVAQQNATPPPAVVTAPVVSERLNLSEVFTGRVEAVQHVDIEARVAGFIETISFNEGQRVSKDDVLFKIEPDAYEAAIQQIQGQIKSAEAERTLAQIELSRQQELLSREVAAEAVVEQAQAEVGKVEGQIVQLQGALKNAELELSYTDVTAPFDGRVGLTDVDLGAFVAPDGTTLVALSSIDPIYVTFPVPEAVLLEVRKRHTSDSGEVGTPQAQITLANGDLYDQDGSVEVVDTVVQQGTDTILIRAVFANPDGLLRDGQLVTIELIEQDSEMSLTFPAQGLQRDQGGYFVYTVAADGTAAKTPIQVDRLSGTSVVVASGLSEADEVIVEGIQKITPGSAVQVETADDGAASQ